MLIMVIKEGVECWEVGIFPRLKKKKKVLKAKLLTRLKSLPAYLQHSLLSSLYREGKEMLTLECLVFHDLGYLELILSLPSSIGVLCSVTDCLMAQQ